MNTPNIISTRIDNRLVHGQVGFTWVKSVGTNLVIVANDEVAKDSIQQRLMEMALPDTIGIRFFSIEKTIEIMNKASSNQLIFLVVKTPEDALKLVEGGLPIHSINVGNMHHDEGKKKIAQFASVGKEDVEAFKKLDKMGVELNLQNLPNDEPINLMDVLEKQQSL